MKHQLAIFFLCSFFSLFADAEDSSCELKPDGGKNMSEKPGNEFTRDKTWHFSADSILQEKEVYSGTGNKKDADKNKDTSKIQTKVSVKNI